MRIWDEKPFKRGQIVRTRRTPTLGFWYSETTCWRRVHDPVGGEPVDIPVSLRADRTYEVIKGRVRAERLLQVSSYWVERCCIVQDMLDGTVFFSPRWVMELA